MSASQSVEQWELECIHDHISGGWPTVLTKLLHCCQGNWLLLLSLSCSFSTSCTRHRHSAWRVVVFFFPCLPIYSWPFHTSIHYFLSPNAALLLKPECNMADRRVFLLKSVHVIVFCRSRLFCNKCRTSSRPCRTRSSGEISCLFDINGHWNSLEKWHNTSFHSNQHCNPLLKNNTNPQPILMYKRISRKRLLDAFFSAASSLV